MMTCGCAIQRHGREAARAQEMSDALASGALSLSDVTDTDWQVVRAYRIARSQVQAEHERERALVESLKAKHGRKRR